MGLVTSNQFNLQPNIFGQGGALSQGINLGEQFRQQQLQNQQQEFLAGGGLQDPNAVENAGQISLDFQQQVADQLGLLDERTGKIDQARLNEAAARLYQTQVSIENEVASPVGGNNWFLPLIVIAFLVVMGIYLFSRVPDEEEPRIQKPRYRTNKK